MHNIDGQPNQCLTARSSIVLHGADIGGCRLVCGRRDAEMMLIMILTLFDWNKVPCFTTGFTRAAPVSPDLVQIDPMGYISMEVAPVNDTPTAEVVIVSEVT